MKDAPTHSAEKPAFARRVLAFLLVSGAALLAYIPSFSVPFQFDDYARLLENVQMHQGNIWKGISWLGGGARLIPSFTMVLNYNLNGENTTGYHVVNFLVHLLTTLGVFQLALQLCATPLLRKSWLAEQRLVLATAAAFLFACHPIQTQSVTYIIQRTAAMATLFYVWSVVFYVSARNDQIRRAARGSATKLVVAAGLAVCAVLSKENAVTLPLTLLVAEGVFFGIRRSWRAYVPFAGTCLLVLAIPVVWKVATWQPMDPDLESVPLLQQILRSLFQHGESPDQRIAPIDYFLTQCTVLPLYLKLFIWPSGLNVDHDVAVVHGVSWVAGAGFAMMTALAAFGFFAARRWPLVGFGILWFFVTMSVESSILPITDVMMEHRLYLAMPGLVLVAATAFVGLFDRWRPVAAGVGIILVLLLPSLTFARNQVWESAMSLWSDALSKSPNKARVHVNVGVAYHAEEKLDEAIHHYCRALEISPTINIARDNIEIALDQQGKLDAIIEDLLRTAKPVGDGPEGGVIFEYDVAEHACPHLKNGGQGSGAGGR
jgi:hypothetical protein